MHTSLERRKWALSKEGNAARLTSESCEDKEGKECIVYFYLW